jgi:lactoylglutathione lyase
LRGSLRCRSLRLCSRAPDTTISPLEFTSDNECRAESGSNLRSFLADCEVPARVLPVRFGYTILYVADVAASLDFYERALGQRRRFLHESGQYAELDTGDTALAFAVHELAASSLPGVYRPRSDAGVPTPFEVCFVTRGVQAAFDRAIEEGAESVSPPQTKPWGQDVAYIRDPDGNLVEIASPASPG